MNFSDPFDYFEVAASDLAKSSDIPMDEARGIAKRVMESYRAAMSADEDDPDGSGLKPRLKDLDDSIREFAQLTHDATCSEGHNIFVTVSCVMYEAMTYADDGTAVYDVFYTFPSPTSMTSAIGLVTVGQDKLASDLGFGVGDADDDDDVD